MTKAAKRFILYTYLIFWGMILAIGGLMVATGSTQPANSLQILSSWAPTLAVVIFWKKLRPNTDLKKFITTKFSTPLNLKTVALTISIHLLFLAGSLLIVSTILKQPIQDLLILSPGFLLSSMLNHSIRGPLGEELGWRGFLMEELLKNFQPLTMSILLGLIWAGWHLPLWFMSGYSGTDLLQYVLFFTLWCVAQSIIITLLYQRNSNLLIPILFHFLSNYLLGLQKVELLLLLKINASLCLLAAIICGVVLYRKRNL